MTTVNLMPLAIFGDGCTRHRASETLAGP